MFIGKPGTGKSHLAKAIAYSALRSGLRVFYTEADALLASLVLPSPAEKRKLIKPVIDADLLVLDDLFLARQLAPQGADELQSVLHKRYKLRRSSLITSNRVIDDWENYLGDATLTTTILDRLMHRSVLVEFEGKSYRLNQAARRLAKGNDSK